MNDPEAFAHVPCNQDTLTKIRQVARATGRSIPSTMAHLIRGPWIILRAAHALPDVADLPDIKRHG